MPMPPTLTALAAAFTAKGESPAETESVRIDWTFVSADGEKEIAKGERVKLETGYRNGGTGGRVYEYSGTQQTIDLAAANYADTSTWKAVAPDLKLSALDGGQGWLLVTGDGTSYTLRRSAASPDRLEVAQTNISAVSAAASLGAAIAGSTGLAVSGAGAVSINSILSEARAHIDHGTVTSGGDVIVEAETSAVISSTVVAASLALGVGGSSGIGVSIGIAVARNLIGTTGADDPVTAGALAYVTDSSINAADDLVIGARATGVISSIVFSGSAAIAAGGSAGVGASGSGVWAENRIASLVTATIDGDRAGGIVADSITVTARDTSLISSFAGAASLAVGLGGSAGVSLSVGVALAKNLIDTDVEASIINAGHGVTSRGAVVVSAKSEAVIDVVAVAASLAAGLGGTAGVGVSGAGADAGNTILSGTRAFIEDSTVISGGAVDLDAANTSTIEAVIAAASVAISGGGVAGVGASIGVSLARNIIGWQSSNVAYDYTIDDDPATLTTGKKVKILHGVRAGDVYEYIGTATLTDPDRTKTGDFLVVQDYANRDLWKRVDLTSQRAPIHAFIKNSSLTTTGALTIDAVSSQTIEATVLAGSVAIAGGGVAGVGVAGAGASAENTVQVEVLAAIDGGGTGVSAASIALKAKDTSIIDATVGTASIAAGFGGVAGVSVAVGISLADNFIGTTVNAFIDNAASVTTTTGAISVEATETATIKTTAVAASAAVGVAGVAGVSFAGAGASATNAIETKVAAVIKDSTLTSAGAVTVEAKNTATIKATIAALSASIGGGLVGVGVAIGAGVAKNEIGWNGSSAPKAEVVATIARAAVTAEGDLTIKAENAATIETEVDAGAVAIGGGLVAGAVSGAGASAKNRMAVKVASILASTTGTGIRAKNVTVAARDISTIKAEAKAASISASFGLIGGSVAVGIALGDNTIANQITAGVDQATIAASGTMTVEAKDAATLSASSAAAAIAASFSLGATLSGGGANATATVTTATLTFVDNSVLTLDDDLSIEANNSATVTTEVKVTSVSLGLIAAAASGSVTTATLTPTVTAFLDHSTVTSPGEITVLAKNTASSSTDSAGLSVSTGVSVGASTATTTAMGTITARVGSNTSVSADVLNLLAEGKDTLVAKSTASSGAYLAAGAGAVAQSTDTSTVRAVLGDNAAVDVTTFVMRADQTQDIDGKADAKALGLAAGTGASVLNTVDSAADVEIGEGVTIKASDGITIGSFNTLAKDDFTNDANLYSGSAGAVNVSVLKSSSTFGTQDDRFRAGVTIGNGAVLDVAGSETSPGTLDISSYTSIKATDSVRVEGVSAYGVSLAQSEIDAYSLSKVDIGAARLTNESGDIYITTRTDSKANTSANLFTAAALTGISGGEADGVVDALNQIGLHGTTIKVGTVHVQAGLDKNAESNILRGYSLTDITTSSLFPNLAIPDPHLSITENNLIIIDGASVVQALGNVFLRAVEGIGGKERGTTSGMMMSLSMVPYGSSIGDETVVSSTNLATIGAEARVESALNNQALIHVLPMWVAGEGGVLERKLADGRLGTLLSDAEKSALGITSSILYVYERLDFSAIPTENAALVDALTDKFYVVKPLELDALSLSYANVQNMLLQQQKAIKGWIASHANNPEALARYQVQLEVVEEALAGLGLTSAVATSSGSVTLVNQEFDLILLDLPNVYAAPGLIFIDAAGHASLRPDAPGWQPLDCPRRRQDRHL
ncbi:MAG: hypothetical protein FD149_77 [Rhodospirillaceae bacterium]|nr:MAG: hypothetical protein FD149_77 [Rhodospirillaceae bacterium]